MNRIKNIAVLMTLLIAPVYAKNNAADMDEKAQKILAAHYQQFRESEYFSGAALSIYVPNDKIRNYYIGRVSHEKNSPNITSDTLFQIGSITKSFTAAIVLQLEKEGKLSLTDTLENQLPLYNKWSTVNLESLLNMTSGLPNYSDTPLWNAKEYAHPHYIWSNEELIDFVYPKHHFSPPLKSGYSYTNTGYVMLDLIIAEITQHDFQQEITHRAIKPAQLANTFYPIPTLDRPVSDRMAQGYNYNQYDNPALVGRDMKDNNLSWAAAAGAVVSNTEDIIKWVKALFIDDTVLNANQKKKLMKMISLTTGKPITETTREDPKGFGLGVSQMISNEIGRFWFYEGETLGFRAVYIYVPCNGIILSSVFNSATNSENDHSKELMLNIYKLVQQHYPKLHC